MFFTFVNDNTIVYSYTYIKKQKFFIYTVSDSIIILPTIFFLKFYLNIHLRTSTFYGAHFLSFSLKKEVEGTH